MKKFFSHHIMGIMAALALMVAASDVAVCCPFLQYQPELPDEVKKLRNF